MNYCKFFRNLLFVFLFFCIPYASFSAETNPFGFQFGMSNKSAKELINSAGYKILLNEVDSKEVRTIIVNGLLVEHPVVLDEVPNTRLEFFDDKLMSVSLNLNFIEKDRFKDAEKRLGDYLKNIYGEPADSEKILSYQLWSWNIKDTKLLMSSDNKKTSIKIKYSYKPIMEKKHQEELSVKRKGTKIQKDPSDQMFKDGNYSRPKFGSYQ